MKGIIVALLSLFQICFNKAEAQEKFEITGTVPKEYDGAIIQLTAPDNPSFQEITTKAKNRKFSLSGYTSSQYERVYVSVNRGMETSKGTRIFIKPSRMEVNFSSFSQEDGIGSISYINVPLVDEEKRYSMYTRPSEDSSSQAFMVLERAKKYNPKGYDLDSLNRIYKIFHERRILRKIDFIKENPDNYISMYHFEHNFFSWGVFRLMGIDSILSIYRMFNEDIQNTSLGKSTLELIRKRQAIWLQNEMPVFSFKTNTGEVVNLSSFRDKKYVLLSFWASWCAQCRENIPALKEIEREYGNKGLQMISISEDQNDTTWLKALEKYSMPWLQARSLPAHPNGPTPSDLYYIKFLPQYFLIDKQGKLICQDWQSKDNDDHQLLKEMLHKLLN